MPPTTAIPLACQEWLKSWSTLKAPDWVLGTPVGATGALYELLSFKGSVLS